MLAVEALSHGWQAALFAAALVLFIVQTFDADARLRINLTACGLALVTFVWFWAELART